MDKKIIDITKHIKNRNKSKNIIGYETGISEAYADELTDEFKKILNEEKKIKNDERRR